MAKKGKKNRRTQLAKRKRSDKEASASSSSSNKKRVQNASSSTSSNTSDSSQRPKRSIKPRYYTVGNEVLDILGADKYEEEILASLPEDEMEYDETYSEPNDDDYIYQSDDGSDEDYEVVHDEDIPDSTQRVTSSTSATNSANKSRSTQSATPRNSGTPGTSNPIASSGTATGTQSDSPTPAIAAKTDDSNKKKQFVPVDKCTRCGIDAECKNCMCVKSKHYCTEACSCKDNCNNRQGKKSEYVTITDCKDKGVFTSASDPSNFNFKGQPRNIPKECKTEKEFLHLYLTQLLMERILQDSLKKQERRNAEQKQKKRAGKIKDAGFFDFKLTLEDIQKKLMADLATSLNVQPSIKLQFLSDSDLYGNDYLKRIGMNSNDYWKTNGVITCNLDLMEAALNSTFDYYYLPGMYYSIDEGLIRFTGRYCYKQYIPNKPAGEGVKTFNGCDAQTGYCHSFFFYRKRFLEDIRDKLIEEDSRCSQTDCGASQCDLYMCDTCNHVFCEDHCVPYGEDDAMKCIVCLELDDLHEIMKQEGKMKPGSKVELYDGDKSVATAVAEDSNTTPPDHTYVKIEEWCSDEWKERYDSDTHVYWENNKLRLKNVPMSNDIFVNVDTTQTDLDIWVQSMRDNPNSDVLKLLVKINKDKKKKESEKLTPRKVVLHFVNLPKQSKYHIYIGDSYYGSYALATELHKAGHHFLFCCKSDHPTELWKDKINNHNLAKGDSNWVTNSDSTIIALSLHDKKVCNFVSNVYGSDTAETSKGKKLPRMVVTYNYGMQGVDRYDRHCSSYKICPHRQISWKKAVFLALIKMAIVNAYILFKLVTDKKSMTQRQFIENVLEQYATSIGRSKEHLTVQNVGKMHLIMKCVKKRENGRTYTGKCHCCASGWSKHRTKTAKPIKFGECVHSNTAFFCSSCRVWLHPECAYRYHHQIVKMRTGNKQKDPVQDKYKYIPSKLPKKAKKK